MSSRYPPAKPNGSANQTRNTVKATVPLRDVFREADYPWVTSHIYRKTVATLMDEAGLSPRAAADQLGHAKVSMTQDVYLGRKTINTAAAKVLEAVAAGV